MEELKINRVEDTEPEIEIIEEGIEVEIEPPLWQVAWQRHLRRVDQFRQWAALPSDPLSESAEDRERGLVPVAGLFALALAAQYGQFSLPYVGDFLLTHDIRERAAWMGFFLLKQWALFVLVLLALASREQRLHTIGFPAMSPVRYGLAGSLVALSVGAALWNVPNLTILEQYVNWVLPVAPAERVLSVLTGLTAAVVEETLFRGFAIVWLYRWSGNLVLAVLFPALVFSAGHSYLSWGNVPLAFGAAIVFSLLFLWKQDLYWPMVLHFAVNSIDLFRL